MTYYCNKSKQKKIYWTKKCHIRSKSLILGTEGARAHIYIYIYTLGKSP